MRPLTFSDDKGTEREWRPGGEESADDAFWEFVVRHRADDNQAFGIEDAESGEALLLLFDSETICRVAVAPSSRTEYSLVTNRGDYRSRVANFVRGGFAALDFPGPWWPDVASLERAQLRAAFDTSWLRRTHPRELRRRLAVLTHVDGREPTTVDGVTHYGFGNRAGDTVDAWFAADGRGLVVTFDHASPLDPDPALYDGAPADLRALAGAATGVFTLTGPCAMADGLVTRLQEAELGVEDTGARLLERFLALEDFTPDAVAATGWWHAEDVAGGFAATAPAPEAPPLDRDTVDRFCRFWADSGYNDRWDVHYVLFDSQDLDEAGADRDELLRLVGTLGLERVDAPPGAASGEVWVRTDPRVDAELGRWA